MMACTRCKGEKVTHSKGFTSIEGKVYPDRTDKCNACNGEGTFPIVDIPAILARIIVTQGKTKGRLKSAMPSPWKTTDVNETRAYFVWRLARFHGGKDMTMPMTAYMVVSGDPFRKELDTLSDAVAKAAFGTDLAAAAVWGKAFGLI